MADPTIKQPENTEGKWYVDQTCVPCHLCIDEAPDLLSYADGETHVFFSKQPQNDSEESLALEAMDACPTEAIGNDG